MKDSLWRWQPGGLAAVSMLKFCCVSFLFCYVYLLFPHSVFGLGSKVKPSQAKLNGWSRKEMLGFCSTSHKEVVSWGFCAPLHLSISDFIASVEVEQRPTGFAFWGPGFEIDECMVGWLQGTNRTTYRHLESFLSYFHKCWCWLRTWSYSLNCNHLCLLLN